jgi:hypothetical protein
MEIKKIVKTAVATVVVIAVVVFVEVILIPKANTYYERYTLLQRRSEIMDKIKDAGDVGKIVENEWPPKLTEPLSSVSLPELEKYRDAMVAAFEKALPIYSEQSKYINFLKEVDSKINQTLPIGEEYIIERKGISIETESSLLVFKVSKSDEILSVNLIYIEKALKEIAKRTNKHYSEQPPDIYDYYNKAQTGKGIDAWAHWLKDNDFLK